MSLFNAWQFYLISYLILIVTFFQTYKLSVKNVKHDGAATIILQLLAGGSALLLTPLFPLQFPSNPTPYLFLIGACVFYAINDRLQTTARKHLEVSVFTILNQLSTVILIIYGFLLLKEPLVLSKIAGMLFIIIGNLFIFYKKGGFVFNKYVGIAMLSAAAFATAVSIDIGNSTKFNLPIYVSSTFLIPALFLIVWERKSAQIIIKEFNTPAKKYYIITGFIWALAVISSLRAFQLKNVSTIVPLGATSVLLNVVVAYLLFSEKSNAAKKIIAAILVIIGTALTVLS